MKTALSTIVRRSHHRLFAVVLACSVFGLGLLAVAPNWHETLHHDSHHANHSCAVDIFAHGSHAAAPSFAIEAPVHVAIETLANQRDCVVAAIALRQPPGRAPPVA